MYRVRVYNLLGMCLDERDFEYGTWKEIGLWLDHYGYIDPSFRLEVFFYDN